MDKSMSSCSKGENHAPKTIFLPEKSIMRMMIKQNIKYSKKESIEKFLLRFGLI